MKLLATIAIILCAGVVAVEQSNSRQLEVAILCDTAYVVGKSFDIRIEASDNDESGVLLIKDSWGLHPHPVVISAGSNTIKWPVPLSQKAGQVKVEYWTKSKRLATASFRLLPQKTMQPIPEVYTGPRFLIAGGVDEAMMVATPLDSLDNPLATGTEVQYKIRGRGGVQSTTGSMTGLFAHTVFQSDLQSGIMNAYISCQQSSSQEFDFFVKSGAPIDFTIIQSKVHGDADGQQLVSVVTDVITDSLQNIIVDGTTVRFGVTTSDGSFSQMTAPTINGVAYAEFPFPQKQQTWKMRALIPGFARSNVLEINFEPSLDEILAHYNPQKNTLDIGPLLTTFGNLAADGTRLKIVLQQHDQEIELSATTRLGQAKIDLSTARVPSGTYDILLTAGGKELILKAINIES